MIASPPESARRAEARARILLGMSEDLQMERASLGAWRLFREAFPEARSLTVVCGPGANGGDGLALCRHALLDGLHPILVFPGPRPSEGTLAGLQLSRLETLGLSPTPWNEVRSLPESFPAVDALFGTGLSRPLASPFDEAARWCSDRPTLALDLPSGLDGRTGTPLGETVRARLTVTFGRPKPGLLLDPGRVFAGTLHPVDIGIPASCWDGEEAIEVLDDDWAARRLPPRARGAHKGTAGKAVLLAGSARYFGAAILSTTAALRSGAGLLIVASVPEVAERIALAVPEAMGRSVVGPAADSWASLLDGAHAVLAGPGIGQDPDTEASLSRLLEAWQGPLVLDADALNLIAARPALRRQAAEHPGALVLTPHPGEAARLLGCSVKELLADPIESARQLAEAFHGIAVLKTSTPLVASSDGRMALGIAGHSGMATGGSGDALAGAVVARLAEGEEPFAAVCQAVRAHARAGEMAGTSGHRGMSVTDLVASLPGAWEEMEA